MPSQWDAKADRDLLLAIIDEGALKSVIWPKIAQKMQEKGYTFTHEACRQHFQKLRKESKSKSASATTSTSTNSNSTPRKRSAAPNKNLGNGHGHANGNGGAEDGDEELEWNRETSSKKQRGAGVKEQAGVSGREREVYRFKAENEGVVIDVERDDIYEA